MVTTHTHTQRRRGPRSSAPALGQVCRGADAGSELHAHMQFSFVECVVLAPAVLRPNLMTDGPLFAATSDV